MERNIFKFEFFVFSFFLWLTCKLAGPLSSDLLVISNCGTHRDHMTTLNIVLYCTLEMYLVAMYFKAEFHKVYKISH